MIAPESPPPETPGPRRQRASLEERFVHMVRERRSGTLRFEDSQGQVHRLRFREGMHVTLRSSMPEASPREPPSAFLATPSTEQLAAMKEAALRLGEEIFRRSASATITLEKRRPRSVAPDSAELDAEAGSDDEEASSGDDEVPIVDASHSHDSPPDTTSAGASPPHPIAIDAFTLLYRGVRARGRDTPLAPAINAPGRRFVLHREATLDDFPLRPGERKIAALLANLARGLDDLRGRRLVPDDELVPFLAFLLVTHNSFFLGDDAAALSPLGDLTPEERIAREATPDAGPDLPRRVGRLGLALFGLGLIPLGVALLGDSDTPARLARTIGAHPELSPLFEKKTPTLAELLRALPNGRLDGALLAHDSATHWLFALASAAVFLGVLLLAVDRGRARRKDLCLTALFSATAGIALLLGVQALGGAVQGVLLVPGGIASGLAALMIYVVQIIRFSYDAALDPSNGLLLSFVGFTLGVGLCEELVKVLPVRDHFRRRGTLDLRGAIAWGLASGIGLGVAEGLIYSSQYYNGVETSSTYVVRFASCVALHAVWAATAAMTVHQHRNAHRARPNLITRAITLFQVVAAPVLLHGLYDTLLKKGLKLPALAVAVVSFAYLVVRIALAEASARTEASARAASPAQ